VPILEFKKVGGYCGSKEKVRGPTYREAGEPNVDWAGGAVKKLRAMEIYEKKRYQLCLLLLNNNVDLKINTGNYRKFVSIRS